MVQGLPPRQDALGLKAFCLVGLKLGLRRKKSDKTRVSPSIPSLFTSCIRRAAGQTTTVTDRTLWVYSL